MATRAFGASVGGGVKCTETVWSLAWFVAEKVADVAAVDVDTPNGGATNAPRNVIVPPGIVYTGADTA